MSMQFSDTAGRTGIIELIEDYTGTQSSSTSSYPLKSKTRDVNNAYANYFSVASQAEGRWQVDDTNQTDYPIITDDLVANQQDYSFTVDANANQILDIYRVEAKMSATGLWQELTPIDMNDVEGIALAEFQKTAAIPLLYDKTANGVVLYPKPSYNSTDGLKIYYTRTPSYFVSTDTTKKPGIPDIFHEYLALRPSYQYALRKGLQMVNSLKQDILAMEEAIKTYYTNRSRDEKRAFRPVRRSSH